MQISSLIFMNMQIYVCKATASEVIILYHMTKFEIYKVGL